MRGGTHFIKTGRDRKNLDRYYKISMDVTRNKSYLFMIYMYR